MAKSKKPSGGHGKKKPSAGAGKAHPKKPRKLLTPAERKRLLRPYQNYEEVARNAVKLWLKNRVVRMVNLTPAKLTRLVARSDKAGHAETEAELDLQAAKDARLQAGHHAWKGLLDLKSTVENAARERPDLLTVFSELVKFMRTGKPASDDSGGTPPSTT